MPKRFTGTELWDEDWFLEMPKEYKLFYFYVKDQCNHAGIWRPNLKIFQMNNNTKISLKDALQYFNAGKERFQVLKSGHWFMPDFFVFQYGTIFNFDNRLHQSVYNLMNQEGIDLTSLRGLLEVKESSRSPQDRGQGKGKGNILYISSIKEEEEEKVNKLDRDSRITVNFWSLFCELYLRKDMKIPSHIQNAKLVEWTDPIRLILQNEECTIDDLRNIYIWLEERKSDDSIFWGDTIHSTTGLRKNLDKVLIKMKKNKPDKVNSIKDWK